MIFKVPNVPFPGFLSNARKLEKENICPHYFPDFNLESSIIVILLLKMFIVKNLTDFRKTVETGVDPRLWFSLDHKWSISDGVASGIRMLFSLDHKLYSSDCDSDANSVASENQPLSCNSSIEFLVIVILLNF